MFFKKLPPQLEANPFVNVSVLISGLIFVLLIGYLDWLTGWEVYWSIFYLVPILLVSWVTMSFRYSAILSILSTVAWITSDLLDHHIYSQTWIIYWNTIVRFSFFLLVGLLSVSARRATLYFKHLSTVDELSGLNNKRAFKENAETERIRSLRLTHPFTLMIFDLDHFKEVNDTLGHLVGDKVIATVGDCLKKNLREIDIAARIGGDEFAVVFSNLNQEAAEKVAKKLLHQLHLAFKEQNWPVTASIGVAVYKKAPSDVNQAVGTADNLLYEVKHSGRNAVLVRNYD